MELNDETGMQLLRNVCINLLHEPCSLAGSWYEESTTFFVYSLPEKPSANSLLRFVMNETDKKRTSKWRWAVVIEKDFSQMGLLVHDSKIEDWCLDGDEQIGLSWLFPCGISKFQMTSCSRSEIRWQFSFPELGIMHGSLELTSDTTSLLRYETMGGKQVLSCTLRRAGAPVPPPKKISGKIQRKLKKQGSYLPSCGPVPEDAPFDSVCRVFRT
mmetsp:Transcript_106915/g.190045  ORF Transcript_106915/g.190045 Transcript_106915/m.190045 type:complete len:214 (-) Transcript_106915:497-1138(-)|eukprot:CAMPEP_0197640982 /NCGR_PEP_ID=MMETSP1338-20131121/15084_1 /TAXON_ID=43686 ORGANISM="Pelagodinium beii, Strain RCC1491" /NCGR_SAMPLE_ID=MMETSP1338 /ASSEMBLY_ACC=CAM_ASM_000754 /LENGTH=213 /DNA_ID=CAMNT_0043213879 /DNA_START=52 /DNA_END=693 /DNA_ORIENTATION=-